MQVVMGWEQGARKEATDKLSEAETIALQEQRKSQKDPKAWRSKIYEPGAEYALCYAQSQIMSAVVAVLSESLTESLKGFYRVRKAYLALEEIAKKDSASLEADEKALKQWDDEHDDEHANGISNEDDDNDEDEFYDADDKQDGTTTTKAYLGHLSSANNDLSKQTESLAINPPAHINGNQVNVPTVSSTVTPPKPLPPPHAVHQLGHILTRRKARSLRLERQLRLAHRHRRDQGYGKATCHTQRKSHFARILP